jgi:hypothetical protein
MAKKTEVETEKNREAQQDQLIAILAEMTVISRKEDTKLSERAVSELTGEILGSVYAVMRTYPPDHARYPNRMRLSFEFEDGYPSSGEAGRYVLAISAPLMNIVRRARREHIKIGKVRDHAEEKLDELMERRGL